MTTNTDRFGTFRLQALQTMSGDENEAFEAKLTRDGEVVAHVSNSGRGGCHDWYWIIPISEAQEEFHALAVKASDDDFEVDDALVWDLIEATKISRKKGVVFLLAEDGDFWVNGVYRSASPKFTVGQIRKAHPDAKFWDKESLSFV